MDHTVLGRGPEGEQRHYDKDGKLIKGEGRVELEGYASYRAELRERAGLPPEVKVKKAPKASGVDALNQLAKLLKQEGIQA